MNYLTSNSEKWDKMFAWLYDNFMFLMDLMWNTKLPLTDISIGYWLLFWMIVRLSIYAVNGTATQYNGITSEVQNGVTNAYQQSVKGGKKVWNARPKDNANYETKVPFYASSSNSNSRKTIYERQTTKSISMKPKKLGYSKQKQIGTKKPNCTFGKRKK